MSNYYHDGPGSGGIALKTALQYNFTRTLKIDVSDGYDVKVLQSLLNRALTNNGGLPSNGVSLLLVDGNFGNATHNAVLLLQHRWFIYRQTYHPSQNLYKDGIAGPITISWVKSMAAYLSQFAAQYPGTYV